MQRINTRSTAWNPPLRGKIRPGTAPRVNVPADERAEYAQFQADMQLAARRRLMATTPAGRVALARAARHANRRLHSYASEEVAVPPKVSMAFNAYDRNNSGFLDHRELRNALKAYGLDTTAREAARVLAAYDDQPTGKLSLIEFHRLVTDLRQGMIRANAAPAYDYERLPARVRSAFAAFDTNRSGYLTYRELRNALRAAGLDASAKGAMRILAAYDRNPDGRLDIGEFAQLVSDLDHGLVKHVTESVPQRARQAFAASDLDGDGLINPRELRHALSKYGFDTTRDAPARTCGAFDATPSRRIDIAQFAGLVQDLELGVVRRPSTAAGAAGAAPAPAAPAPAVGIRRPVTPSGGGVRPPRYESLVPDETPDALFSRASEDPGLMRGPLATAPASEADEDDRMSVLTYDDGEGDVAIGARARGQRSMTNNFLRRQLARERASRHVAEREAHEARELASESRKQVDALRLNGATRDLDVAAGATRKAAGLSYDGYDPAGGGSGGGNPGPMASASLNHLPPHLAAPAAPPQSRGHSLLLRDLHSFEASLLTAIDGKAGYDSDMCRRGVLARALRDANPHNDRYCNREEFARAIGKFSLGAAAHAGAKPGRSHFVIREPRTPSYDVQRALVDQLFERYSEASGGERLIDADALYGRLKRSVEPDGRLSKNKTGLDLYAESLEEELRDHPHARGPFGRHPKRELLSFQRPAS